MVTVGSRSREGVGVHLEQLAVGNPIDDDNVLADQDVRGAISSRMTVVPPPWELTNSTLSGAPSN